MTTVAMVFWTVSLMDPAMDILLDRFFCSVSPGPREENYGCEDNNPSGDGKDSVKMCAT